MEEITILQKKQLKNVLHNLCELATFRKNQTPVDSPLKTASGLILE